VLFLFENYALDTDRRELRHGPTAIPVEPQVFDVLAYLIENRGRVASKDDLVAAIWGGRIVSESTLTTRINAARCAIGDSGAEQRLIKTLARKGVRFVGRSGAAAARCGAGAASPARRGARQAPDHRAKAGRCRR
jgi:DNA-binding winged helix-turn-helix (wHTH) protein